jgi:hypothetical protein
MVQMLAWGVSKKFYPPTQDIFLLQYELHCTLMLALQRRFLMMALKVLSGVACMTVLLATGAFAEILGVQPGTSDNPKDNVPKEIQRGTASGGTVGSGGSGPGTRSGELVDMRKEKPQPVTQQDLERNVEKTQGGGAAIAAEKLGETSKAAEESTKEIKKKD